MASPVILHHYNEADRFPDPNLMTELEVPDIMTDDELAPPPSESAPAGPDRADAPVSEVTERFLRAIIAKVSLDRIEELHLFAPLRQGATETGIAVIAARAPIAPSAPEADPSPTESTPAPLVEVVDAEFETADSLVALPLEATDDVPDEPIGELADELADDQTDDLTRVDAITSPAVHRHTVYTARYRLVLKGPDRGKWEAEVVDEADAPLITVEMVVRGVQRRAGEDTEILRYSGRQIARALRMEWPLPSE
jgi:hypothetical protein